MLNQPIDYSALTPIELVQAINNSGENIAQYQQAEAEYRRRLMLIPVPLQYRPFPELIFELGFYAGNTDVMGTELVCEGIMHDDSDDFSYKTLPYIDTTSTKRMLCPACAMKA